MSELTLSGVKVHTGNLVNSMVVKGLGLSDGGLKGVNDTTV